MDRFTLLVWLFVLTSTSCELVPKPRTTPRPTWVAKVERLEPSGPGSSGLERCSVDGKSCGALTAGALAALPGRLVTGGGAQAAIRLDANATLYLGENTVVVAPDAPVRSVVLERGTVSVEQRDGGVTQLVAAGHPIEIRRRSAVAVRLLGSGEATVTVHRGAATVHGGKAPRTVSPGQTVALAAGKPIDERAVFAGRVAPVAEVRIDEHTGPDERRGFGRVTARIPGSAQVVSGVRLTRHHVRAVVKDGFARTEVEEELFNDTGRVLEGRYQFALPPGASLSRLALWVGHELVEGEIVERDRAARIFRGIVDDTVRPRDPALLEWVGGSELSLKIFPIEPRRGRRVVLAYNEALVSEAGTMRYRYPLGLGHDRTTRIDEFSLTVTAYDSRGALRDVRTLGYVAPSTEHSGGVTTEFSRQGFAPSQDFVVEYRVPQGSAPIGLFVPDWGNAERELPEVAASDKDSSYFALHLTAELPAGTTPPRPRQGDRVVVVDRSFSQSEESLGAEVRLARALLEDLGENERLAVLVCDSACDAYPKEGLVRASAETIAKATAWLSTATTPEGASDLAGAVLAATARLEANGRGQVVVLSDGRTTAGEMGASAVAERIRPSVARRRVDLRLLGVGRSVDEVLLSGLASAVGAAYERVAADASLSDRIEALAIALRTPVVEAPVLELPAQYVAVEPRRLPNLRLGQTVLVTGKLREAQLAPITLRGTLLGAPYEFEPKLGPAERIRQNPLVPRLWAEQAIAELEARGALAPVDEIVALSRRHHVLSRRTSLLVLENAQMFAEFGVRRTQGPNAVRRAVPEVAAAQNLWGDDIGDSFGSGGLGLSGIGEGGGGRGHGSIGAGQGFGSGHGRLAGSHAIRAPLLRMGPTTVSGRLPPEVIQRAVRQRYGAFRACYEQGLARNPQLAGRVSMRFVIGRDGRVSHVTNHGSDLPDQAVVACVLGQAYALSFPEPEGGIVTVVYPLLFAPGDATELLYSRPWATPRPQDSLLPSYRPVTHQAGSEQWRARGESELTRVRQAAQNKPESRRAWSKLIATLLRLGRFDEAYREGRELVRRDPDDAPTHERLAWAAAARGDGARAATELGTVAELEPRRASAQLAAARAFEAAGDETRACAHWRAAATLEAKPGSARFEAVRCRARLGDLAGARQELATFADDPKVEPLRAALDSGKVPAYSPTTDASGWFEARVDCDSTAEKCPVAAIVTPQGRVVSPWTPELGRASASRIALKRMSTGRYRTLLIGGEPGSRGKLTLSVNGSAYVRKFTYEGGVVTAVESDVNG
jgi:tetratricopeptide (TPR) repeat protein